MKPFLMGSEIEYAVSGRTPHGPLSAREVHTLLEDALRSERACLTDAGAMHAIYLENGARFYLDYGDHPEYATPECMTPVQVTAHDKASEQLLHLARQKVLLSHPQHQITLVKNNLSPTFPDDVTWGNHESYTCWIDQHRAAQALMAHMVSRTVYCGAGCLSGFEGSCAFELSQRARHVYHATGCDTTSDRALFGTRLRKSSDRSDHGWTRAHLITKDSQRSPLGIYLTFGTTGLLFLLLNEGYTLGKGLELQDPVQALRAVSCDPWLRRELLLTDGRRLTALQLQECYLAECERALPGSDLPDWCWEVVKHWKETLAQLSRDPLRLASRLDPYYKLFVFDHELGRANVSWCELRDAIQWLQRLRQDVSGPVLGALLQDDATGLNLEEETSLCAIRHNLGSHAERTLDRLRLAMRLQHYDLHYHEIGGIYDQMLAAGHLQRVVTTPQLIEEATREAPPGGRAALRAECIRLFQDEGWLCEWRYLYHRDKNDFVDLRDPFGHQFHPVHWPTLLQEHPNDHDLLEISLQLGRY